MMWGGRTVTLDTFRDWIQYRCDHGQCKYRGPERASYLEALDDCVTHAETDCTG